jgi:outer membrane protein assembly factor BamA
MSRSLLRACNGRDRLARRPGALWLALLVLPTLAQATDPPAPSPRSDPPAEHHPWTRDPAIPPDEALEAAKAVIGQIIIDNQNIFNTEDPRDDNWLFRLANSLHGRTHEGVIRAQLLFKSGDRYSRRILDETERILRADNYFYDAWILPVAYHDGIVDVRVTTRDVWTLNPGFNYSRSGGTNTTGVQLEDLNTAGTGTDVRLLHEINVDRTESIVEVSNTHAFGTWTSVSLDYGHLSDGWMKDFNINHPFYALETNYAGGISGNNDAQTDYLYDRGNIIDEFHAQHNFAQLYGGWSPGLENGWVRRWSAGFTYDEYRFTALPPATWPGATLVPEDRRFAYPWLEFDILEDDYLKYWNHDQIYRTEDFYLGTTATLRVGWADSALGSSMSALMFQSTTGTGFRHGGSTLLLAGDFSGRVEDGRLYNGVMDGSVRYYVEQSSNWLFFTTLTGAKGWRLDLDNQVLLGGDNGLRGYPLRYQDGDARALFTVEQRYFTNWFPFRLFRVGGAVFFDAGRTWGSAPLAGPSLGLLKDAGFGLRFGNARSGLGNVIHVDLAFPFETRGTTIQKIQFLVQTQSSF